MYCRDCKNYQKGFDGKPGYCGSPLADYWSHEAIPENGFGVSVEDYEKGTTVLYVGELFGCINFSERLNEIEERANEFRSQNIV